jgi:hypothetical protein
MCNECTGSYVQKLAITLLCGPATTIVAEVLREFDEPIVHPPGRYHPRVLGRLAEDGMWEGWLEFVPLDPGKPVAVSPVESRQPQREYLEYWAQGLSVVYAEGALERALHPLAVRPRVTGPPLSERPAPRPVTPSVRVVPEPVLDPFEVGRGNLDILRQELHALDRPRLLNIITAFDLNPASKDVAPLSDEQLVTFIVVAVEAQMIHRAR